ncbi:MAG TPA: ABC transporter ATP-binding protein [Anaerolineae bacterium]|nr:ABC transporter ATP-binding protein [Anaerolineae bacterium]
MSEAIVVKNLVYRYGELTAVNDISFNVGRGEVLGFLGPNGAGKSTTIKMLTGQMRPHEGEAILLGMDITKQTKQVQAQIGVSFEATNLYEQMSGVENLKLFARLFGVKDFKAEALLERVGLAERGRDKVERYSKGMKQRLMVARSLVNRPQILFLDEPTEGLDPTSAAAIRRIVEEERERGATIFLTTHDMLEADKLADRVAFINQGKIVALDRPAVLKQAYGQRKVLVEVLTAEGETEKREITLDEADTPAQMEKLFANEKVVTVHSEEATLEDIFIEITGRRLVG